MHYDSSTCHLIQNFDEAEFNLTVVNVEGWVDIVANSGIKAVLSVQRNNSEQNQGHNEATDKREWSPKITVNVCNNEQTNNKSKHLRIFREDYIDKLNSF